MSDDPNEDHDGRPQRGWTSGRGGDGREGEQQIEGILTGSRSQMGGASSPVFLPISPMRNRSSFPGQTGRLESTGVDSSSATRQAQFYAIGSGTSPIFKLPRGVGTSGVSGGETLAAPTAIRAGPGQLAYPIQSPVYPPPHPSHQQTSIYDRTLHSTVSQDALPILPISSPGYLQRPVSIGFAPVRSQQEGRALSPDYSEYQRRPLSAMSHRSNDTSGSQESRRSENRKRRKQPVRKNSSPQTVGDSNDRPPKPRAQNLRGDPFRSSRLKTEPCAFWKANKTCKFGKSCNFAHGEDELKYKTLAALEEAGEVDVEIYRCRPCVTFVATGACPFDQRCWGLHDPRIVGKHPSWLSHADSDLNKWSVGKGANVDKCYHQLMSSTYNCSALYSYAPRKKWKSDERLTLEAWNHFIAYICNTDQSGIRKADNGLLEDIHRLEIVLRMRETRKGQCYAFYPDHFLHGELCMVLQTRFFTIASGTNRGSRDVIDVTDDVQGGIITPDSSQGTIIAHEIAFGPVGNPSVRSVSVWFNLKLSDLVKCRIQDAKKFKRTHHRVKKPDSRDMSFSSSSGINSLSGIDNSNDIPFYNYQPLDNASFELVTDILRHRRDCLDFSFLMSTEKANWIAEKQSLDHQNQRLVKRFESLRCHWMASSWPVMKGLTKINVETKIPPIDGTYVFDPEEYDNFQIEFSFGQDFVEGNDIVSNKSKMAIGLLWQSFLINLQLIAHKLPKGPTIDPTAKINEVYCSLDRLPIFRELSLGRSKSQKLQLPRLSKSASLGLYPRGMPSTSWFQCLIKDWEELLEYHESKRKEKAKSNFNLVVREELAAAEEVVSGEVAAKQAEVDDALRNMLRDGARSWKRLQLFYCAPAE